MLQGDGSVTPIRRLTLPARGARPPSLKGGPEEGNGTGPWLTRPPSREGLKKGRRRWNGVERGRSIGMLFVIRDPVSVVRVPLLWVNGVSGVDLYTRIDAQRCLHVPLRRPCDIRVCRGR